MQVRHYVVLFDIDNTLMDFKACSRNKVVWIGSAALWQEYIEVLKKCFDTDKTKIHIGIATSKLRYYKDGINIQNGDVLSAAVIEDDVFILNINVKAVGVGKNLGLKRFLNPDLIFFTSGKCKVINALNHVKDILQKQLQLPDILLDKSNIMLIDDHKYHCELASASGFASICVENLVKVDQAKREAQIGSLFLKIFENFNLPIPVKMLKTVGIIEDEDNEKESIREVEEELINYMSSAEEMGITTLKQMSHHKKRNSETSKIQKSAVPPQLLGFFTGKKPSWNGNWEHPEHYMFRK